MLLHSFFSSVIIIRLFPRSMEPTQDIIAAFVDELLKAADLGEVDPEFEKAYKSRMELLVADRLGTELTDMLPDAVADDFAKLIESNPSEDKLFAFYQKHIPDLPTQVAAVLGRMRQDFIEKAQTLKQ